MCTVLYSFFSKLCLCVFAATKEIYDDVGAILVAQSDQFCYIDDFE